MDPERNLHSPRRICQLRCRQRPGGESPLSRLPDKSGLIGTVTCNSIARTRVAAEATRANTTPKPENLAPNTVGPGEPLAQESRTTENRPGHVGKGDRFHFGRKRHQGLRQSGLLRQGVLTCVVLVVA
jgi:hypothetical protein